MTIDLSFVCDCQFYIDEKEHQENIDGTKRGYYITTKTLEGGRKGVILVMKLAEIKNKLIFEGYKLKQIDSENILAEK